MKTKSLILMAVAMMLSFGASAQMKISGVVRDTAGKAVADVTVTDGFTCVQTDAKGRYKLTAHRDAYHVYYSIPSTYKVSLKDGHPDFYTKLDKGVKKYNFTLEPNDKNEKNFRLVMVADPQAQCPFHVKRFERETVPDMRAYVDSQSLPCYGVTLGDIIYNDGKHNSSDLMPKMRAAMSCKNTHMPFFQTIGNHDYTYPPVAADENSSTFNLAYQRLFESVMGPVNYSWNRGDVHIVSLRDMQYRSASSGSKYDNGLTVEQYEWLKQDLACVPKDKMIILCIHIAMYNRTSPYFEQVRTMLAEFKEAHIMVGHTHFMNHAINKKGIYEHVHAAASGAFWWSCVNGDGVPNGYTIYDVEGAHMKNWQYKSVGHDISYQIRMYRGDAEFGGEFEKFRYPYSHDTVLANVFMSDKNWKVQLFEDGVLTGDMELIKPSKDSVPEVDSSRDWWAVGYHIGVIGRSYGKVKNSKSKMNGGGRSGYLTRCQHMYRLQLKNPDAKQIKVVATDTNGNVYEQTHFTESFDYSENALMNELCTTPRDVLDREY